MDFSYTLLQTPEVSYDFHIILDEFFVHCVAEASIFLSFPDDFRWIFRTFFW